MNSHYKSILDLDLQIPSYPLPKASQYMCSSIRGPKEQEKTGGLLVIGESSYKSNEHRMTSLQPQTPAPDYNVTMLDQSSNC